LEEEVCSYAEAGFQGLYQGADMLAPQGGRSPPKGDVSVISLQMHQGSGGDGGAVPDGQIHSLFLTCLPGHADNADFYGKYAGSFTLSSKFTSTDFGKTLPGDAGSSDAITVPQGFGTACKVKKKKPKVMWQCPKCGQPKSAAHDAKQIACPHCNNKRFSTTNQSIVGGNTWKMMATQAESAKRLFSSARACPAGKPVSKKKKTILDDSDE